MVRALKRDVDPKIMTRRTKGLIELSNDKNEWRYMGDSTQIDIPRPAIKYDTSVYHMWENVHNNGERWTIKSPYGNPGDIIWVREKWYAVELEGEGVGNQFITFDDEWKDGDPNPSEKRIVNTFHKWGCHPSIHMPKTVARIFLQIVNIRPERLQDITEKDAIREGVLRINPNGSPPLYKDYQDEQQCHHHAKSSFAGLWESINGLESYGKNPWVWVIEFKRVEKLANFLAD